MFHDVCNSCNTLGEIEYKQLRPCLLHAKYANEHIFSCLCVINDEKTTKQITIPSHYLQKCGAIRLFQGFDAELDKSGGLLQFPRATRLLFLSANKTRTPKNRPISGRVHRQNVRTLTFSIRIFVSLSRRMASSKYSRRSLMAWIRASHCAATRRSNSKHESCSPQ